MKKEFTEIEIGFIDYTEKQIFLSNPTQSTDIDDPDESGWSPIV